MPEPVWTPPDWDTLPEPAWAPPDWDTLPHPSWEPIPPIIPPTITSEVAENAIAAIDSRIADLTKETPATWTPAGGEPKGLLNDLSYVRLFTNYGVDSDAFVPERDTSCWAYTLDLTCTSPYNSQHGRHMSGTLISPRHIILTTHYHFEVGTVITFVTKDNTVITRTIAGIYVGHLTDSYTMPGHAGWHDVTPPGRPNIGPVSSYDLDDLTIYVLDSDVPWDEEDSNKRITFAKVLPDNYTDYFPSNLYGARIPGIRLDQEEKALIGDLGIISNIQGMTYFYIPYDTKRQCFYEALIGGDSGNPGFIFINDEPIILTVWTYGTGGSGTSITAKKALINQILTHLSEEAGLSAGEVANNNTAWQLTEKNLSLFAPA
jgi:hypothetical protein